MDVTSDLRGIKGLFYGELTMEQEILPVSEDLKEAAKRYATEGDEISGLYIIDEEVWAFEAGAKWQKEQFEKNRLKHCNSITNEQAELEQGFIDQHLDKYNRMPTFLDAIEYGHEQAIEQLMAKAIDGIARPDDGEVWCDLKSFNFEDGAKCKMILIKED